MWHDLIEIIGNAFGFQRRLTKNSRDVEQLQQEVRTLISHAEWTAYEIQRLRDELQHMRDEIQNLRRDEAKEREMMALRLELALARGDKRLPPPVASAPPLPLPDKD